MTRPPPPPRAAPATLSQAEAASATAAVSESEEEQCRRRKAKENLDVGAATAVFSSTVLLGSAFLPKEAKHHPAGNKVRLAVSLLLSFATFLAGKALVLLSLTMMGRQALVSDGHRAAAKCFVAACAALSVLTLLSLLALLPGGVYLYIGLAVVAATTLLAAGAQWVLTRMRGGGGGGEAADGEEDDDKGEEELDAASKTTCGITNSAFGGLVGVLFSASKISDSGGVAAAPGDSSVESAAHAAIFFTFATAILGVFVMTVSKVTTDTDRRRRRRRRRLLATATRLANALLLCSLACAALSAAFVVLRYRVFAAFAPLVFAAALCFLLRHCVVVRHGGDDGAAAANLQENQNQEAHRIKAVEDMASMVTAAALGGIMSVLGGALGEKDRDKWGSNGVLMVFLTSAFVSGFGFMVLAAAPGSATAVLAPVARVLVWSTVALFTAWRCQG